MPRWRNWQTHQLEGLAGATPCRFKSCPGHLDEDSIRKKLAAVRREFFSCASSRLVNRRQSCRKLRRFDPQVAHTHPVACATSSDSTSGTFHSGRGWSLSGRKVRKGCGIACADPVSRWNRCLPSRTPARQTPRRHDLSEGMSVFRPERAVTARVAVPVLDDPDCKLDVSAPPGFMTESCVNRKTTFACPGNFSPVRAGSSCARCSHPSSDASPSEWLDLKYAHVCSGFYGGPKSPSRIRPRCRNSGDVLRGTRSTATVASPPRRNRSCVSMRSRRNSSSHRPASRGRSRVRSPVQIRGWLR